MIDTLARRDLLSATAALALPGCATTQLATAPSGNCFARVDVSADRVIRTVAGLRPYRPGGFVVRAEAMSDKRIVHNYGHGGAGITMSWGTARLATDLGLPGHSGAVAVIGAGVVGLSTARLIQEAGFAVTVYAAALPPETTSNIAGGQFYPYSLYEPEQVSAEWHRQFETALDYGWRRFQIMVGDDYGVRWLPTFAEARTMDPLIATFPPAVQLLSDAENPFPARMHRYVTLYIETGRYLWRLMRDLREAGGKIAVRRFSTVTEVAALPETLIFNCTGLGSRELFGDAQLIPVRGQLAILLPQPEIDYAVTSRAGYMFPRPDGIVLGGTYERGEESATAEPSAIAGIVAAHRQFFGAMRCTA